MRADEPEFFSVGAEVPHRLSQLGLVLFRLVGVVVLLLLLVVVVQQPLFHLLEVELQLSGTGVTGCVGGAAAAASGGGGG